MQPYQQRVIDEKIELDVKITALDDFCMSTKFKDVYKAEQRLLAEQIGHMINYSNVLGQRIEAFGEIQ